MWMARMYATSLSGGKMQDQWSHNAPIAMIAPRNTGLIHLRRAAKNLLGRHAPLQRASIRGREIISFCHAKR